VSESLRAPAMQCWMSMSACVPSCIATIESPAVIAVQTQLKQIPRSTVYLFQKFVRAVLGGMPWQELSNMQSCATALAAVIHSWINAHLKGEQALVAIARRCHRESSVRECAESVRALNCLVH
jgi:hypothetical protein